jgi:outer membrane lipoprotein carrier protein
MKKRLLSRLLIIKPCLLLALLLAAEAFAKTDVDALAEKLQRLETLSGKFQQTLVDAKGETLQASSGVFYLQRPGYFRWETQQPFPQLLVSDLQSIWLYDPDLAQVTVREYNEKVSATPALLLSGDVEKINQHYQVSKQDNNHYILKPISPQELFSELAVFFVDGQLTKMTLRDSLAQTTTFTFLEAVQNQSIAPELFTFIPPKGTDLISGN